ncbi:MAG: 16S rRNA (uracil(1498)-N(3))-methyltransferase [Christensenellaceae bacterium]|jgi:16S rRNA (uracil1498-N3)-methyltransferase|nr:16S rRNA (uracil(1498)-N(3))-methyltransferase [Christensenellaceae bacterium]
MEKRFFADNIDGDIIVLKGEEFEHLSRVLRLKAGDTAECFCDDSDIYACKIGEVTKNAVFLHIENKYPCDCNPKTRVAVFQALPKGDKLELITQKLSELGVSELVLFRSRFTNLKPNIVRTDRLHKIAVGAAKQCGRTSIMKISGPLKFEQVISQLKNYDTVIFANETEKNTQKMQLKGNIAIVIGSEGGFEASEIKGIVEAGGVSTSLGKRILRTETAAIALTAIVMHEVDEL